MDVGEIIKGQKSIELYQKGKNTVTKLWGQIGMKLRLIGIDAENPQRMFSNK